MSIHFHPLRVSRVRADTEDAMVLAFAVPPELRSTFDFAQGQYLTLRGTVGGQDLRRSYSICSGVDDGELCVGVRRVPGGAFSTWLHEQVKEGDTLQVIPPQGHFGVALDPAARRHYLGIAAGSGITPILSIMKTVLAREPGSRFTLIYGNRNQRSTMFKEELEDLKNRYLTRVVLHHVFSREQTDVPLYAGRLTRERIGDFLRTLVPAAGVDHAFVCGPHGLNDEAEAALRDAGLAAERIHIERFGVPDAERATAQQHSAKPGDAEHARVVVVRDGLTRDVEFRTSHPSILQAAQDAGLELPFSCQSGVCATCRARVLEGQVRMDRNFALDANDLQAGFVLTCQAHPLTERVVVSFDDR